MKKLYLPLVLLLAFSMLLGACGPQAEPVVEEPVVEEPVVEEPVVEEPVVVDPADADLDGGYGKMVSTMEGYNALKDIPAIAEMLASDTPPFLLDVRNPEELEEKGHIEGAVNIPIRDLAKNLDLLPSFDTPIIAYCGSGWRAAMAMPALIALGWNDVKTFHPPSYTGWVEEGYPIVEGAAPEAMVLNAADPDPAMVASVDETLSAIPEGWGVITAETLATEIVENPDLILVDVRKPGEVEESMIDAPNVVWVTLDDFINLQDQWPADLDAPIVVYCKKGHRSTVAMTILWNYGYTDVRSLKGGFVGWKEAELPISTSTPDLDGGYGKMISTMEGYNALKDIPAIAEMLASDNPPFLLDVRNPEELEEKGHIEGAVNIPIRDLAKNLDLLPSFDTPIIAYCGSGWRAAMAMPALIALGWNDVKTFHPPSYGGWVEEGYPIVEGAAPEAMVLNAADPDPTMVASVDETFSAIPEGWGVITAETLATEIVENPDLILIDVRKPEEVEANVIDAPNVLWVTLDDFVNLQDQWPADLDAPIVTYCKKGHRSTVAMTILWNYGYTDVRSLKGGFVGWTESEYPVAEFAAP